MPDMAEELGGIRRRRSYRYTQKTQDNAPGKNSHHLVRFLYVQCCLARISRGELARRSGVSLRTLNYWWKGEHPNPALCQLEAAMKVFGYGLKPTYIGED